MKFGVLGFRYNNFGHFEDQLQRCGYYTVNLGDNTQSIAARHIYRELGISDDEVILINRDALPNYQDERAVLIMNGVFLDWCFPIPPSIIPLFIGFQAKEDVIKGNIEFLKRHEPIGCRDSATAFLLQANGVQAFTTGCITLALPPRTNWPTKPKTLIVYGHGAGDFPSDILKHLPATIADTVEFIFHRLAVNTFPLSAEDCLLAERYETDLLRKYEEATLVLTPLHHVAAPCLAKGIPTIICRRQMDVRFSFLEELLPIYTPENFHLVDWNPTAVNVNNIREKLIQTVRSQIDMALTEGLRH